MPKIKQEIVDSPDALLTKKEPIGEEIRRVSTRIRKRAMEAPSKDAEPARERPLKVPKMEELEGHSSDSGIDEKCIDNTKSEGKPSRNEVEEGDFKLGDLVWAKARNEFWPAKVAKPPRNQKTPKKKNQLYLYFFGSQKRSWVPKNKLVPHSEHVVKSSPQKMPLLLRKAIANITRHSRRASGKVSIKREVADAVPLENEAESEDASTEPRVEELPRQQDTRRWMSVRGLLLGASSPESAGPRGVWLPSPIPSFDVTKVSESVQCKRLTPTAKKIGFIGLGLIGRGIVKNLLNSGHDVTVWNRSSEKCFIFVSKAGAFHVATPSDVVARCDIVFCCVSDPEAVRSVVFGSSGVLQGIRNSAPGSKGYVELTSVDPATSREIARAVASAGGKYLEAPVSGSRQLAEEGGLCVLGAGDKSLFRACESCFLAFCKHAYFLSEQVGCGSRMGLILSMVKGTVLAALAEALALVERCKLSPANFLEILDLGEFNCPMLTEKGKAIIHRNFSTNNSLKHQQKTMNLALSLGDECFQAMPTTSAANEVYKHAKLLQYADHDASAVFLGVKY